MEEARRAIGIPPCRGEGIEVRYFSRIDGARGAVAAELVLDIPRSRTKEEVEISKRGLPKGCVHCCQ